jgi:hypothetical protein
MNAGPTDVSNEALAYACVVRVQQAVPPASDVRVTIDYGSARSAIRPDALHVTEVPYTAESPDGVVEGSYVCGVAPEAPQDFRFFSDHERMSVTQWNEYASAARPGNLEIPA